MQPIIDSLMRLIHITDPHLSSLESFSFFSLRGKRRSGYLSWYKKRRFVHRPEILDQLTLAVHGESPDQILLTGDLVHIGLEQEIIEAGAWLERLGPPERVMLIPGNHDLYAGDSLAAVWKHWRAYLPGSDYPAVRDIGTTRLIALNSSVVTPIFSATGKLGAEQRAAVPQTLSPERFNVMLIHHPPLPGMTLRRKALRDAALLEECFSCRAPDLLLYGHIHVNRSSDFGQMRMFCTASASSRRNASYRVFDVSDEPGGWNLSMQLKTLEDPGDGNCRFSITEQQQWEVRHSPDDSVETGDLLALGRQN